MAVQSPNIDAAIAFSLEECNCGHMKLKQEQRKALTEILGGKDSIVVLPTGYGKSLIYMLLPRAYLDLYMRRCSTCTESQKSMVLVVEPLTSLMAHHVERATSMNLQPASLSYHRDLCSDDFKSVAGASISDTRSA